MNKDDDNTCPFHDLHEKRFDKMDERSEKIDAKLSDISEGLVALQTQFISYSNNNIEEIKSINSCIVAIKDKVTKLQIGDAVRKVQQGGWGMLGGMVPVAIALLLWWIRGV